MRQHHFVKSLLCRLDGRLTVSVEIYWHSNY
jgi:hypothetical protein